MISDVLFQAIRQIDQYLAEYPHYRADDELHEDIREVQLQMRLLIHRLDQPPGAAITEKAIKTVSGADGFML